MTERVKQIRFFWDQGHRDAKIVATALEYDVEYVELVFAALGEIEKRQNGSKGADSSAPAPQMMLQPIINEESSAEQIYKDNQRAVAIKLTQLALSNNPEMQAIAAKAAMYVNEEATGRNEARAKKQNNTLLLNIGDALLSLKRANEAVSKSLGAPITGAVVLDV